MADIEKLVFKGRDIKAFVEREEQELVEALAIKSTDLVPILLRYHLLLENLMERFILVSHKRGDVIIQNARL